MEIAPHHVRVTPFEADVELALRRRIVHRGAVVAVDRIVGVRIDVAQQIARVLGREVAEQVFQRLFAGIRCRSQQPFPLDLALQVEGTAPVDVGFVAVMVGIARHQFCTIPLVDRVASDGQVGDGDVEPVTVGNRHIAAESRQATIGLCHADINRMRACRQNLAEHETPLFIHWRGEPQGLNRLTRRQVAAADCHRATLHRDIAQRQRVFTPARENLTRNRLAVGKRPRAGTHGQRLQRGLVEPAFAVVHPQHILVVASAKIGGGETRATGVRLHRHRPLRGLAPAQRQDHMRG